MKSTNAYAHKQGETAIKTDFFRLSEGWTYGL